MSIQRRTVFYDFTGGFVRFWDWALVTTTLGTMAEPFTVDNRNSNPTLQFDPTDEIVRIDEIHAGDIDRHKYILSGGDSVIHGGYQIPRVGR